MDYEIERREGYKAVGHCKTDVLIVGGGAAGLMSAIAAAREGASVLIAEKESRIGKKILATGNGRCNLSNTAICGEDAPVYYNQSVFVASVLKRYGCATIRSLFEEFGLLTTADEGGWVFPRTRSAHSVLAVLLNEAKRQGVDIQTNWETLRIEATREENGGFLAEAESKSVSAKALVMACGARAGVTLCADIPSVRPTPIAGPLRTESDPLKGLDGIRARCLIRLLDAGVLVAQEAGEILFRRYGVSGIAVFNLSRFAVSGQELSVDFFPEYAEPELRSLLLARWRGRLCDRSRGHSSVSAGEFLDGLLHTRLAQAILRRVGVNATEGAEEPLLDDLAGVMKDYRLVITGGPDIAQAQVTRGGFALGGFDPMTLQSLVWPRLFAAGECLDVDGPCGGFNLHWAWASGLVAGQQAGKSIGQQAD
jgi:predicted Rossmann fold flavoprotein